MIVTSQLKRQTLALANFAIGGTIGIASTNVDRASVITIAQTTTGQTLTIPNPTITTDSPTLSILNVGTASFTMLGIPVEPGTGITLQWSGVDSLWHTTGDVGTKKFYAQQTLVAGANIITHNLNALVPKAISVTVRDDATGETVDVNITGYATNTITLSPLTAVALCNIVIFS